VAADLDAELLAAQSRLTSLAATVTVTERGWAPQVPVRTFTGTLRYLAPESIALRLSDRTRYPSSRWRPADVVVVGTPTERWSQGMPACPVAALPGCQPPGPRPDAVNNREPFAADIPAALDLVVPVGSFNVPVPTESLPTRSMAGRTAIGVSVTVAQLAPLLGGLEQAGNWRELYPADPVEVWLDRASLVPLEVTVRAASGPDRARWAVLRGYVDQAGAPILELALSQVAVNVALPSGSFPAPPPGIRTRDAAFHDGPLNAGWPAPVRLPAGLLPYRSGVVAGPGGSPVAIRSWTDGRSWVEVAATRSWPGGALFGDLGDVASRRIGPAIGVYYLGERGDRVGLHGAAIDIVVSGSLAQSDLVSIAGRLGVRGLDVPAGWAGAANTTLDQAIAARPGLLVPSGLVGFQAPSARLDAGTVTLSYWGAGDRSFQLAEAAGATLTPPVDPDVRSVAVRGVVGRYQPALGELEWIEQGSVVSLRSQSLSLADLAAIAAGMRAP
jgi:hypothetical protein